MKTLGKNNDVRLGLGKHIRELREEGGYSQHEFARLVSMDRSYLIGIEKGRKNVSIDMLIRIATGLDVEVTELFPPTGQAGAISAESAARANHTEGTSKPEDVEFQSHDS